MILLEHAKSFQQIPCLNPVYFDICHAFNLFKSFAELEDNLIRSD